MKANIVLIGMPGCGKTTVGKHLARNSALTFLDLDQEIERSAGKSIPLIFETEGESRFRQLETSCARAASALAGLVIATGGGIILRSENMEALAKTGLIIFLDRSVSDICSSDLSGRPLIAGDVKRVVELYDSRIGLYRQYADITVDGSAPAGEVTERILSLLEGQRPRA